MTADVDVRLAELMTEHRAPLLHLCQRRLGGDRHLAEDVVQDTFLKLRRALLSGQDISNVRGWLRTVAQNGTVDELRRRSSLVLVEPPDFISFGRRADGVVDATDIGDPELETAWGGLSPRHREVLHLREIEGLRYDEIANAMSTGISAVETLLFRARSALRREYARAAATATSVPVAAGPLGQSWVGRGVLRLAGRVDPDLTIAGRLVGLTDAITARAAEVVAAIAVVGALSSGASVPAPVLPVPPPTVPALVVPVVPDVPAAPVLPSIPARPATTVPPPPAAPARPEVLDDAVSPVETVVEDLVRDLTDTFEEISGATARFD